MVSQCGVCYNPDHRALDTHAHPHHPHHPHPHPVSNMWSTFYKSKAGGREVLKNPTGTWWFGMEAISIWLGRRDEIKGKWNRGELCQRSRGHGTSDYNRMKKVWPSLEWGGGWVRSGSLAQKLLSVSEIHRQLPLELEAEGFLFPGGKEMGLNYRGEQK